MKRNTGITCLLCALLVGGGFFANADVTTGPLSEKGPGDVPALIRALKDAKMGTRWNAALLLGEIGEIAAVPALIECAAGDENPRVRQRAFEALDKLGDTAAVEVLIAALDDEDRFVRRDAARALGMLGDESAVPALIARLEDGEGFVRRDAAWALGEIGDASAVPALKASSQEQAEAYSDEIPLAPHEMSPVARESYFALGKMGGDAAAESLTYLVNNASGRDFGGYPPFHSKMWPYDPCLADTRARAALALGLTGASGLPTLKEILAGHEDTEVRRAAVKALQQMGGEPAIEGLAATAAGDPDYSLRSEVIRFLGESGDQNALPILQKARETARDIEDSRWRGRINRRVNEAIASIERGE